jgi:hypothetical protein
MTVDGGFERSRLVTFAIALPAATYPTFESAAAVVRPLDRSVQRHAGVGRVAAVSGLPPQRGRNRFGTDIENYAAPSQASNSVDYYQTVTTGTFETMEIPVVRGRRFQRTDRAGAPWRS